MTAAAFSGIGLSWNSNLSPISNSSRNPDGFRTKMAVSVEKKQKFTLQKSEEIFNAAKVHNPPNSLISIFFGRFCELGFSSFFFFFFSLC